VDGSGEILVPVIQDLELKIKLGNKVDESTAQAGGNNVEINVDHSVDISKKDTKIKAEKSFNRPKKEIVKLNFKSNKRRKK
jgi:hypothetical protein